MESQINPEQNNQRKHLSFVEKKSIVYRIKLVPLQKRIEEGTKKDRSYNPHRRDSEPTSPKDRRRNNKLECSNAL